MLDSQVDCSSVQLNPKSEDMTMCCQYSGVQERRWRTGGSKIIRYRLALIACGFNPSMQRIDEIAQPVYRSLVSFA
ncbi:hypothetical protein, partial [Burkholderia paludis]|uniref:hypothetical protein n=1 Tax=Burkholderia paludis TaxID=1506587 RepID=UPI001C2E430A